MLLGVGLGAVVLVGSTAAGGRSFPADEVVQEAPAAADTAKDAPSRPSFASEASAITVEAVVLGKDGQPVRGLTQGDFTILEDGRPQAIIGFEARDLLPVASSPQNPASPVPPPIVASNEPASGGPGRVLALLIDDLGLSSVTALQLRPQLAGWIRTRADDRDEITIATTSGDLWWSDAVGRGREDLLAALARVTGKKLAESQAAGGMTVWEAYRISVVEHGREPQPFKGMAGRSPTGGSTRFLGNNVIDRVLQRWYDRGLCGDTPMGPDVERCKRLVQLAAEETHSRWILRAQATLGALGRLASSLAVSPGRKSILLVSEDFLQDDSLGRSVREAIAGLQRDNAVVYFLGALGLTGNPVFSVDQKGAPRSQDIGRIGTEQTQLSVAGGEALADATGGVAVTSSNDLASGLERMALDSSVYYLLGYEPDRPPDGKWRKLRVKVQREGVTVRAWSGYYAGRDREKSKESHAGFLAGPGGSGIPLRLSCRPIARAEGGARVLVGLDVKTLALGITPGSEGPAAAFDVTLQSLSRDKPVPQIVAQRVTLRADAIPRAPWWVYAHDVVLPPGPAQIRVLVRDLATGRTGSVMSRLDVPEQLQDLPVELQQEARAFVMRPHDGAREVAVVAEVPSAPSDGEDAVPASPPTHLLLVARVEDQSGRLIERRTQEWWGEEPGSDARFRLQFPLPPGDYTLETAVLDPVVGALSVKRGDLRVSPADGVALSSLVVAGDAVQVPEPPSPSDDPFQVGRVAFWPRLAPRVESGMDELPLLLSVYPGNDAEPAELTLELSQGQQIVRRWRPELPAPDASGRRPWLGRVPLSELSPGQYALTARASQGASSAQESLVLEVLAPAAGAAPEGENPDDPALAALLEKAARYVVGYEDAFRDLVAEEAYDQQTLALQQRRHTRSEVVFTMLEAPFAWGTFRDVFEVDGQPVRDRDARLERLFVYQDRSTLDQARAIRSESARYSLGLYRDFNDPTAPLMFLLPQNQRRFRFEAKGRRRFPEGEGVEVRFQELERPTMIRWKGRTDLPTHGRFWIDPQNGTVFRSDISFRLPVDAVDIGVNPRTARITVDYRYERRLALWVPKEMKELYPGLQARAEYSGYRRFSVETHETFSVPHGGDDDHPAR
jgi:VWFA-related protein